MNHLQYCYETWYEYDACRGCQLTSVLFPCHHYHAVDCEDLGAESVGPHFILVCEKWSLRNVQILEWAEFSAERKKKRGGCVKCTFRFWFVNHSFMLCYSFQINCDLVAFRISLLLPYITVGLLWSRLSYLSHVARPFLGPRLVDSDGIQLTWVILVLRIERSVIQSSYEFTHSLLTYSMLGCT
jgi:hypothetical protein